MRVSALARLKLSCKRAADKGTAGPENRFFTLKTRGWDFYFYFCAPTPMLSAQRLVRILLRKLLDLDLDLYPCFNQETTAESVYH